MEGLNPPLADRDAPGASAGAWARARIDLMAEILGHLVAMEAIKALVEYAPSAVAGDMLVVDPVTLETTLHRLVQLPWCRVCGGNVAG